MPNPLNLFPARVPIGSVTGADGRQYDVLMSAEFSRALSDLLVRVGGPTGLGADDLGMLAATDVDYSAQIAAMHQKIDALEQQLQAAMALNGRLAQLSNLVQGIEMASAFRDPFRVNWERPGTIGSLTPNKVKATTLELTAATGTAPLIVASTTNVPNLNASSLNGKTFASPGPIGSTVQDIVQGSSFKCPFGGNLLGLSASSYLVQAETSAVIRSYAVGPSAAAYGSFEHYAATSTPAVQLVYTASSTGFKVALAFGCNGAAPQGAYALGAAAVDLPTVIALANNLRTMAINNGMGA